MPALVQLSTYIGLCELLDVYTGTLKYGADPFFKILFLEDSEIVLEIEFLWEDKVFMGHF